MKIIFCDIDGVLNSPHDTGKYVSDMEESKLLLLSKLIKETNTDGIILTSDRRLSSVDLANKLDAFDIYDIKVIGILRDPYTDKDDSRGLQIKDFIDNEGLDIESFVILDDNDDQISTYFKKEFVKTSRFIGLDNELCLTINNLLLKKS